MNLDDTEEWIKRLSKGSIYAASEDRRRAINKVRAVLGFYLDRELKAYEWEVVHYSRN